MSKITKQIFQSVGKGFVNLLYYPIGRSSVSNNVSPEIIKKIRSQIQYVVCEFTNPIRNVNVREICESISESFKK